MTLRGFISELLNKNKYCSHREYLINELNKLDYSKPITIAEFGVGYGSSPLLYDYLAKHENMTVHAFDNNHQWLERINKKYNHDRYLYNYVKSWEEALAFFKSTCKACDLLFVDQAPFEARIKTIDVLKSISKVILLHDYDFFNKGRIDDIHDVGKQSVFAKYHDRHNLEGHYSKLPPTLIMRRNT